MEGLFLYGYRDVWTLTIGELSARWQRIALEREPITERTHCPWRLAGECDDLDRHVLVKVKAMTVVNEPIVSYFLKTDALPEHVPLKKAPWWCVEWSSFLLNMRTHCQNCWQPKLYILWSCQNVEQTLPLRSSRRDGQKTYMKCLIWSSDEEVMPSRRYSVVRSSDPECREF